MELVALYLVLQFAYLGKYQVCELGKRNMCNQFVYKNFCFWNWLHLIWPYSSRTWESIRYANWARGICATSSFTKFSVLRIGCTHKSRGFGAQKVYLSNLKIRQLFILRRGKTEVDKVRRLFEKHLFPSAGL